jgi:hypothetical protein
MGMEPAGEPSEYQQGKSIQMINPNQKQVGELQL